MPLSVLVVEDDTAWREALCEMYVDLLDPEDLVCEASTMRAARRMLKGKAFDLLSLDINLNQPGAPQGHGDGRALLREVSGREPSKLHPVGGLVVVTAFAYDEEMEFVLATDEKIERARMTFSSLLQKHFGDDHLYFSKVEGMSIEESVATIRHELSGKLLALCNAQNIFRKEGQHWHIQYSRAEVKRLNDYKGLRRIHYLLQRPWEPVTCKELVDLTETPDPDDLDRRRREMPAERLAEEGLFEKIERGVEKNDKKARRNYQERLNEIDDQIEMAQDTGNEARVADLENEKGFLLDELGYTGTGEQVRDSLRRHYDTVQTSIRRDRERIGEFDEELEAYLQKTVDTGYTCVYQEPDEPVKWLL